MTLEARETECINSPKSAIEDMLAKVGDKSLQTLFNSILNSRPFQRLKDIRFLGAIDYLLVPRPNGRHGFVRHSRFEHSLGVARLALRYAELTETPVRDRKLLLAAALLHDVGHAPLSHSLEPLFQDRFGINHHLAMAKIVQGDVPIGLGIAEALKQGGLTVDRVIELASGNSDGFNGFFSGPINFDTIDGIMRASSYNKASKRHLDTTAILEAATLRSNERHRQTVDDFWLLKDQVYGSIVNSRHGVLADYASRLALSHCLNLRPEDFYLTETTIFRRVPTLRSMLVSKSIENRLGREVDSEITFNLRRFHVDEVGNFFQGRDRLRYRQTKIRRSIAPRAVETVTGDRALRGFFDDRHGV